VGKFYAGKFVVDGFYHYNGGEYLFTLSPEFEPLNAGKWYVLQLCLCFL